VHVERERGLKKGREGGEGMEGDTKETSVRKEVYCVTIQTSHCHILQLSSFCPSIPQAAKPITAHIITHYTSSYSPT
jgi:hypothetical protein